MSWDNVPGRNGEGYADPTAAAALSNVQRSQRGLQSKRAGEHFENLITASLNWYKDKGVAFIEKTPEPMRPLRPPNRQGQFLACYTKAGQPDFKGTPTGKPLDLRNRNRQQAGGNESPEAAGDLVAGRDYDPDTGEVLETAGQTTDDHKTATGRVVSIGHRAAQA